MKWPLIWQLVCNFQTGYLLNGHEWHRWRYVCLQAWLQQRRSTTKLSSQWCPLKRHKICFKFDFISNKLSLCAQGLKLSLRCAHFLSEKKGMVESTFSSTLTDECELRMCTNNSQILDVCVWCIVRRSFLKKKAWQDDQDPDVQQVIYVWRTILFSSAESTKWQQNHFKNTYFGQISFIVLASNCILSWIMHMRKGVSSWRVYFLRMTNGL